MIVEIVADNSVAPVPVADNSVAPVPVADNSVAPVPVADNSVAPADIVELYQSGMKPKEISDITGIKIGTVKQKIYRWKIDNG